MSLSRHFYDLIEVQSALAYCLINRRPSEACFWLLELIDSNETSIALATMIELYLVRYGCNRLVWLLEARQATMGGFIDPDKLIELCYGLATLGPEAIDISLIASSIVYVHDASSSVPPVRSIPDVPGLPIGTALENYIMKALATGNVRAAFWAVHYSNDESIVKICNHYRLNMAPKIGNCFDSLRNLNTWSGLDYSPRIHLLLCFMLITFAHKPAAIIAQSFEGLRRPSAHINDEIAEWDELVGRRERRIYAIPRDCLYMSTWRGMMPYTKTTINQINNMGANPQLTYSVINECSYWREIFESHGCNTDDTWEAFCEWAFPDDIPDEWSAEEKAKSHGPGISNPGEVPMWRRYLRKWISTTYMSEDKASSINNNNSLLTDVIGKIDLKPKNIWSIGKMFNELEELAYQKFVMVVSSFNEDDLEILKPDDIKNEIVMSRLLDGLVLK
jgi:hypothetical protein